MTQVMANGLSLEVDCRGEAAHEPILLIMGLGRQMSPLSRTFADRIIARGFRAILFDNRDVGLSEKITHAGPPDIDAIRKAVAAGRRPAAAYTLDDMADDAVGVLDALGIARAHVAGVSMGGMIAQLVAANHPGRTLSLTSINSTTGNPRLPGPTDTALAVLNSHGPDPRTDLEGFLDHAVASARAVGSPLYPADEAALREHALSGFRRCHYPLGYARQYAAIVAAPDRRPRLRTITAPTLVIHGADNPLVRVEAGQDTAAHIPGAQLLAIPGMGHDIPVPLHGMIIEAIAALAGRARAAPEAHGAGVVKP
jgi:pimeloyl-ACP methyl ester carboxylesterase